MPEALDLLKTRRSVKPIELNGPGPSATELETILTVASRVPDHGKLTPWRFIVFDGDARLKAGAAIEAIFKANNPAATARPWRSRFRANASRSTKTAGKRSPKRSRQASS